MTKDFDKKEKWNELIRKNGQFEEIFNKMEIVKERGTEETFKKVLMLVEEIDETRYEEEVQFLYEEINDVLDNYMKEDINWWDKFYIKKRNDKKLKEIFIAIDKADRNETEYFLKEVINMVENLDEDKYKYDIGIFNRKIKILEKRLERQVSRNFGSMLRSLREERGLSLSRLGDLAGVSASYINRIELGERKAPSYPIIERLAEALNVNISTLLVSAGAKVENKETKSIREIIFSNNISILEGKEPLNVEKKQQLIEIIDYIFKMQWEDNKHIEMLKLMDLIDDLKKQNIS